MMSQNRQAKLADERNHLALQIELLAEQEDTETLTLLRKVCDHLGIKQSAKRELEKPTDPEHLHAEIKKAEQDKIKPT
jgi:uncharacterized membrane protein